LYAVAGLVSFCWIVAERVERQIFQKNRTCLRMAAVILSCMAAFMEIPYQICPKLEAAGRPTFYIFADSVTAGIGDASVVIWPKLLARSHAINVQDHSQMGAKVRSMLRKTEGLTLGDG